MSLIKSEQTSILRAKPLYILMIIVKKNINMILAMMKTWLRWLIAALIYIMALAIIFMACRLYRNRKIAFVFPDGGGDDWCAHQHRHTQKWIVVFILLPFTSATILLSLLHTLYCITLLFDFFASFLEIIAATPNIFSPRRALRWKYSMWPRVERRSFSISGRWSDAAQHRRAARRNRWFSLGRRQYFSGGQPYWGWPHSLAIKASSSAGAIRWWY